MHSRYRRLHNRSICGRLHNRCASAPAWCSVLSVYDFSTKKTTLCSLVTENWLLQLVCEMKYRLIVWRSSLSVPQLLDSPSPLLTNRGTMLWDKLCWLLALLALSSGALAASNEPLSAPRIFLSFKGKALKILVVSVTHCLVLCFSRDITASGRFCHQSFMSWFYCG